MGTTPKRLGNGEWRMRMIIIMENENKDSCQNDIRLT
jgi:hypothetical protein